MSDQIENPLCFPKPRLAICHVKKLNIIEEATARGYEQMCLISINPDGNPSAYYEINRKLRQCIYGEVRVGIELKPSIVPGLFVRTEVKVAIKVSSKARLAASQNPNEDPVKEISTLQNMESHDNIIRLIEALHDEKNIYSITEFCDGGELFEVIKNHGALSEHQGRKCFREILLGLAHIKRCGVVHRDLTLENVLLANGRCKIMDFGMCLLAPRCPTNGHARRMPPQGPCGKKNYMAPEVLENISPFFGHLVDMWSLGIILFILLTGYPAMEAATALDPRFRMIRDGQLGRMLAEWNIKLTNEAVDLLQSMLKVNPYERLSINDILAHSWMLVDGRDDLEPESESNP